VALMRSRDVGIISYGSAAYDMKPRQTFCVSAAKVTA